MACKRIKDRTNLVARADLKVTGSRHYFQLYLWRDLISFRANSMDNEKAVACVNFEPTIIEFSNNTENEIIRPKRGEIHFVVGKWNIEIVAHEIGHALIERMRLFPPHADAIIEQTADAEEEICHELGQWVDNVYRWLWEHNPNVLWKYKS